MNWLLVIAVAGCLTYGASAFSYGSVSSLPIAARTDGSTR